MLRIYKCNLQNMQNEIKSPFIYIDTSPRHCVYFLQAHERKVLFTYSLITRYTISLNLPKHLLVAIKTVYNTTDSFSRSEGRRACVIHTK